MHVAIVIVLLLCAVLAYRAVAHTQGTESSETDARPSDATNGGPGRKTTLEESLVRDGAIDLSAHVEAERSRQIGDYPDVEVSVGVHGDVIEKTIRLGREVSPKDVYWLKSLILSEQQANNYASYLSGLDERYGVDGSQMRYTYLDRAGAVVAQATYSRSGLVGYEAAEAEVTLADVWPDVNVEGPLTEGVARPLEQAGQFESVSMRVESNTVTFTCTASRQGSDVGALLLALREGWADRLVRTAAVVEDAVLIPAIAMRVVVVDRDGREVATLTCSRGEISGGIIRPER